MGASWLKLGAVFVMGISAWLSLADPVPAQQLREKHVPENAEQVNDWTRFLDTLHKLHLHRLEGRTITTTEASGGYSRLPDFYREISYTDAETGRLLGIIAWETANPDRIHTIELFIYDDAGRVIRDYYARYLPEFRNAPVQTLINLHGYDGDMHGFRQFDASGVRIYERCWGEIFGEPVEISLDEEDLPPPPALSASEPYLACFGFLPREAGRYLDPLSAEAGISKAKIERDTSDVEADIARLNQAIAARPGDAGAYVERADAYFLVRDFDAAIADYSAAIDLDAGLDQAWFGRGMARGRNGQLAEGIADLGVFIRLNPESSLGYTKRGVRYIWQGDHARAEADLSRAVELDPANAEAHDDLGVVKALKGEMAEARRHFSLTIRLDPSYQKAYHNLAMVFHLEGNDLRALAAIDSSLKLNPQGRDSLNLKGNILDSLGRHEEAKDLRESAKFLPEGNWSERLAVE